MNTGSTLIEHLENLERNLTQDLSALKIAITALKGEAPAEEEEQEPGLDYEIVESLLEVYLLPRDKSFIVDLIKSCKRAGMNKDDLSSLLKRVVKINSKNELRDIKKYIFGSINNFKKA